MRVAHSEFHPAIREFMHIVRYFNLAIEWLSSSGPPVTLNQSFSKESFETARFLTARLIETSLRFTVCSGVRGR